MCIALAGSSQHYAVAAVCRTIHLPDGTMGDVRGKLWRVGGGGLVATTGDAATLEALGRVATTGQPSTGKQLRALMGRAYPAAAEGAVRAWPDADPSESAMYAAFPNGHVYSVNPGRPGLDYDEANYLEVSWPWPKGDPLGAEPERRLQPIGAQMRTPERPARVIRAVAEMIDEVRKAGALISREVEIGVTTAGGHTVVVGGEASQLRAITQAALRAAALHTREIAA